MEVELADAIALGVLLYLSSLLLYFLLFSGDMALI